MKIYVVTRSPSVEEYICVHKKILREHCLYISRSLDDAFNQPNTEYVFELELKEETLFEAFAAVYGEYQLDNFQVELKNVYKKSYVSV